jgi:hypothetical protein
MGYKRPYFQPSCLPLGLTRPCRPVFRFRAIKAVVHQAEEGGFGAKVPALPGWVTQAETLDELRGKPDCSHDVKVSPAG